MNEVETNQSVDADLKQHNLPKTKGEDADNHSEAENCTDDDIQERTQQDDSGGTSLEINQKPGVSGQSNAENQDPDTPDGTCIKNENRAVPHSGDGPRQRTSNKKQKKEHQGEGDTRGHVETKKTPSRSNKLPAILLVFLGFFVSVIFYKWILSPPLQTEFNLLKMFYQELEKVQANFPSQHHELWRRSRIHLKKHLNLTNPTEPVSLLLTSGRGAERTLGCLAQQLATAFSNTLNSSVLGIYGTSKSAQDSDQVKLDIDKALKEAFEGGARAAVIHRFEELPPGSTLIFYRYCDHENSAFKKVFLAFTVMLQKEMDFPPNVSLGMVEEVVREYLKERFVSTDRVAKFNQMDVDKLSGLWSRISHLILPVAAEQKIEQHGCQT